MSGVKMLAGFACGITALLFILLLNTENPETVLYEQTVETLMRQEKLSSHADIEERFPVLNDIQQDIKKMAHLNEMVRNKTYNPSPVASQEERIQLKMYRNQIDQLRLGVKSALSQLTDSYAENEF